MPYYFASYVGAGTDLDPCKPSVTDPGWSAIDLRPDGGATLGGGGLNVCLLHLPVASPNPSLTLIGLDPADLLGAVTVAAINAKLGTSVAPGRLDQIISSLLVNPPVNRWKPLMATLDMGRYEIWLGGLFWTQPVISGGVLPATDDFNRPNENPLSDGGKWTATTGPAGDLQVVSNQCEATIRLNKDGGRWWNADVFNSDHYSQVVLTSVAADATGAGNGVTIRTANGADTYYRMIGNSNTTNDTQVRKHVAGVSTLLFNRLDGWKVNDTLKLDASGSTIRSYRNGVQTQSITDTAITGGAPGAFYSSTAAVLPTMDNWQGDNVAATTSNVRPRLFTLLGVGS